jgi:hypothetical protein
MTYTNSRHQRRKRLLYTRCCDGIATAEQLRQMYDDSLEITFKTFAVHADIKPMLGDMGYATGRNEKGLRLENDFLVRYFKSKFLGQPCYYMVHSAIDHIFLFPEQFPLLCTD